MDSTNLEDLRLPLTIVTRLIRESIPAGVSVAKEVKVAIARSAAIFIVHATTYANEYAVAHKRKNVTAADVFHAIKILECEELEKPLTEAMNGFKLQREQRMEQRKRLINQRRSNAQNKENDLQENSDEVVVRPPTALASDENIDDDE